jgi:hypothetical protein
MRRSKKVNATLGQLLARWLDGAWGALMVETRSGFRYGGLGAASEGENIGILSGRFAIQSCLP